MDILWMALFAAGIAAAFGALDIVGSGVMNMAMDEMPPTQGSDQGGPMASKMEGEMGN